MLPRLGVTLRTALAIGGLAFAAIELGGACLDHYDEDYGTCHPDAGADCGVAAAPQAPSEPGSGTGTGAH